MTFSVRGLTRGVMGGITAYRRGALAGQEQNREIAVAEAARQREIAAAEQARQRQAKQDELAAMYQQIEANLASRRQAQQEQEWKEGAPGREALATQRTQPGPYRPMTREQWLADEREKARLGAQYRPTPTPRSPVNPRMAELDRAIDDARGAIATARGGLSAQTARMGRPRTPSDTTAFREIEAQAARLRQLTTERDSLSRGGQVADPWAGAFDVQD